VGAHRIGSVAGQRFLVVIVVQDGQTASAVAAGVLLGVVVVVVD